jgi:hypothetical protein
MSLYQQTATSDGTLIELGVSIEYLRRADIEVYFDGVLTAEGDGWAWVGATSSTIEFDPPVPDGTEIIVHRSTDIDTLIHLYNNGALFRKQSIDESFKQLIYFAQEFSATAGDLESEFLPLPHSATPSAGDNLTGSRSDHVHLAQTSSTTAFTPVDTIVGTTVQAAVAEVSGDVTAETAARVAFEAALAAAGGSGLVGFVYATVYGANTIGKWLQDLATSTGSGLIGFLQAGTGAVLRTLQAKLREMPISVKDFGAVGDGVTDDYAAIVLAYTAAVAAGCALHFPAGLYYIGTNELVFSSGGMTITCAAGTEIRGNGSADGYVVTFASAGGTSPAMSTHPTNLNVTGMRIRTVATPGSLSAAAGRVAWRVACSYGIFTDCGATVSADIDGSGLRLEADNSGSGPYYNTFVDCNVQGAQTALTTGYGIALRQRTGTAIATRYPNTNSFLGGRVGGFATNIELCGNGNRFFGMANENFPAYGVAHHWVSPVASSNVSNVVYTPYMEGAATGYLVDAGVVNAAVNGNALVTGVTTLVNDPSGALMISGYDGVRAFRLPTLPSPSVARSGIFLGNANNTDTTTLDWYEEGTWVPTLVGGTTAGDYTVVPTGASFTRIGNTMHVETRMTITVNSAGTGNAVFGGLTYAKGANKYFGGTVQTSNVTFAASTASVVPAIFTTASSSTFMLQCLRSAATPVTIPITDIITGSVITISMTYQL